MIDIKKKRTPSEKLSRLVDKLGAVASIERTVLSDPFTEICHAKDRGLFTCTRPAGHVGIHVALAGSYVCHVWRADAGKPEPEKETYSTEDVDRMIEELGDLVNKQRSTREGHLCNQSDRGMWACSRKTDHIGCHVAVGSELCHVWLNEERK
jgi:hypothetical protein